VKSTIMAPPFIYFFERLRCRFYRAG
jgi:hypothetical protein